MRRVLRHIILKPIDMNTREQEKPVRGSKKSKTNMGDLIHRMKMIIDDAQVVIDHLESGKGMNEQSKCADDAWTHISNIEIAIDLGSTESREWKKFTR